MTEKPAQKRKTQQNISSKDMQREKEKLIQYLDYEIELIRDERQQPGWTKWAISGSLAALIWLILEEVEKGGFSINLIAIWLIVVSLVADVLTNFLLIINDSNKASLSTRRFFLTNQLIGNNRLLIFLPIIRYALVVFTFVYFVQYLSNIASISFYLLNGYLLIVWIIILFVSFFRLPLPPVNSLVEMGVSRKIFDLILLVLGVIPLVEILWLPQTLSATMVDIRIVCLLSAVFYLFFLIVRVGNNSPLMPLLIEIRRGLQFERMDFSFAKEQVEIAILGLKLSTIFQEYISKLLNLLEEFYDEIEVVISLMDTMQKNIKGVNGRPSKATHEINESLMTSIQLRLDKLEKIIMKQIPSAFSQFINRVSFAEKIYKVDNQEIAAIQDPVFRAIEKASRQMIKLHNKWENLKKTIKKYSAPS